MAVMSCVQCPGSALSPLSREGLHPYPCSLVGDNDRNLAGSSPQRSVGAPDAQRGLSPPGMAAISRSLWLTPAPLAALEPSCRRQHRDPSPDTSAAMGRGSAVVRAGQEAAAARVPGRRRRQRRRIGAGVSGRAGAALRALSAARARNSLPGDTLTCPGIRSGLGGD